MNTNISDNAIDSCETSTAVPAEPQECSSSTETKKLPTVRLDNSDYLNYWGSGIYDLSPHACGRWI